MPNKSNKKRKVASKKNKKKKAGTSGLLNIKKSHKKKSNSRANSGIKSKKTKKKIDKSSTLKPKKAKKIKGNNNKNKSNKSHLKSKTLVSNPKIKSKTNIKYDSFKNSEGYEYILKGRELYDNNKLKSAIKNYEKGIELLEQDLILVDNAIEKRKRREKIDKYRSVLMKIQQELYAKQNKNKKVEIKKPERNNNVGNIKSYDGYQYIIKGMEYENNGDYDRAMNEYDKGINDLSGILIQIDNQREKKIWKENIDGFIHQKQRCQFKLNEMNRKIVKHEVVRTKNWTTLEETKGYDNILKAKKYDKQGDYDTAIIFYDKGISELEESLHLIDNSIERRERKNIVDGYRHDMQKLKNRYISTTIYFGVTIYI